MFATLQLYMSATLHLFFPFAFFLDKLLSMCYHPTNKTPKYVQLPSTCYYYLKILSFQFAQLPSTESVSGVALLALFLILVPGLGALFSPITGTSTP